MLSRLFPHGKHGCETDYLGHIASLWDFGADTRGYLGLAISLRSQLLISIWYAVPRHRSARIEELRLSIQEMELVWLAMG
jgi:hypothetical protein